MFPEKLFFETSLDCDVLTNFELVSLLLKLSVEQNERLSHEL